MPSSAALPGYTNLHQAAREIGIKHATLASQIRQLEDVTGTTLLHADPDGIITLTTDGEQFARDVVQVLDARGAGSASRRSRVSRDGPVTAELPLWWGEIPRSSPVTRGGPQLIPFSGGLAHHSPRCRSRASSSSRRPVLVITPSPLSCGTTARHVAGFRHSTLISGWAALNRSSLITWSTYPAGTSRNKHYS